MSQKHEQTIESLSKSEGFSHTHQISKSEGDWDQVNKKKLPVEAYAVVGDPEDEATWKYPHHFVESAGREDEHGKYCKGTLLVHYEGMTIESAKADKDGDNAAIAHFVEHWKTIDPDRDGHPLRNKTGINAYFEQKCVTPFAFESPVDMLIGDNGPLAKSAPIKLVALSGEVLDRPEWGPCIQDLAGCKHKDRVAIDYRHNPDEIIGYVNGFDISSGQLVLSGALVPQRTHQRTEEIIGNMQQGVPYEASIYFPPWRPEDLKIEVFEAGAKVMVNGREIIAPEPSLTVFRQFELRGVAICPHGADGSTAAYLQSDSNRKVNITVQKHRKEESMSKTVVEAPAVSQAVVETKKDEKAIKEEVKFEQKTKQEDVKEEKDHKEPDGDEGVEMVKKFGAKFGAEKAMEYLSKGMKYADALEQYCDDMKKTMESKAQEESKPKEEKVEEQSASQSAKPKIKFQQTSVESSFGISQSEIEIFKQFARDNGWDNAKLELMMKRHNECKQESKRLGCYSPDPNAAKFSNDGTTLSKVGRE